MGKREHERTTSKLTMLLKKRGLDDNFDASERELAQLRHEITLLKWQKTQAEDRANRLELSSRQHAAAPSAGAGYPSAPQPMAFGYQPGAICVQQPKRQRVPMAT